MSPEEREIEGAKISARLRRPLNYCAVSGCEYPAESRELCDAHYKQLLRHGRVKRVDINRRSTVERAIAHAKRKRVR